ncbi:MAG: MarR family transcriptional regulator [Kineosporiaceae bacterium]|nr:MarR family transcriptional regulator [Kineosporiaceae bacterium]
MSSATWTFLSNHAHVLLAVSREPEIRVRDLAAQVGVTERRVQTIVAELEDEGYLARHRIGRRTHYQLLSGRPFRHQLEAGRSVDDLLALFSASRSRARHVLADS